MTPYKFSSLAELAAQLEPGQELCCDTETVGLYGKIRLFQAYAPNLDGVHLVEWPSPFELAVFINNYDTKWHNAHYDFTTLQEHSSTSWRPKEFDDTLLLARLAMYTMDEYSYDVVVSVVLGYDPYKEQGLDKKALQKSTWGLALTEDQLLYAATDVYHMPLVFEAVKSVKDSVSYKLDMLTLRRCLQFQHVGLPVDQTRLGALLAKTQSDLDDMRMPINVNSWQQTRSYLDCTESDDLALARMSLEGNERAANVRKARKLGKLISFLKKFDSERIYGKFKPAARSGRLTCADQNLQQLPRKSKSVFGFHPDEGKVLIYADFAQLELRTICAIVSCTAMEELFRKGEDLHGFTAAMLFGEDWKPEQRQLSKTYNFSFLYGGGINMLISILIKTANVLLTEQQGNRDRNRWRSLWKEIYVWQEKGISKWRKGLPGSTPLGRRYTAQMMTDQLNIENQGAGAEVSKLALHYFGETLDKYADQGVALCNFIHDSYIVEAPNDPAIYQPVATALAKAMQEGWFELSKCLAIKDLPMPVEVKVGYNWGDIESKEVEDLWTYTLEGMEYAPV